MPRSQIETIVPYGNANAQIHIGEKGDYLTCCGRNREGWSVIDETADLASFLDNVYGCKHCKNALLR